jgi:L-lactate dehydrogenase (cytochrome)
MSRLDRCYSIADLRCEARRCLPWPVWEFLEGAADDEWSLRNNERAFHRYTLIPHSLTDIRHIDTRTTVLGRTVDWPVLLAPTGMSRLYHAAGEIGAARAAAATGTFYSLSTYSSQSLEAVAQATSGPKIFQLFTSPGWEKSLELIDRARAAGYQALCLTVDTTAAPNKERDHRSGLESGRFSARSVLSVLAHPRWALGFVRGGPPTLANLGVGVRVAKALQWKEADQLDWERAKQIRDRWPGPFALKGVLCVDDARRAAEIGIDAVIISNHGGRQLDSVPAPIDLVAAFATAVGDRIEILVDSGFRRGTDVLKALTLGAKGVLVGRPYLYGLAAGGEAGVRRAIEILKDEIVRDMRLLGASKLALLDDSFRRETLR